MSGSLDKLDEKKAQLKHQLDTARENGDEKEIKTISGFLNKNSHTIKYSKIARENPREDHKGKKKEEPTKPLIRKWRKRKHWTI
jgi:ATP-dependent exoDNAse (exonuclease V) beta subunit